MKKIILSLIFCTSLSSLAMWEEKPNASNGGHPDFVTSHGNKSVQGITIQNDYGTEEFGIYIKVIEHEREKIISRLVKEGFTVQMALEDGDFDGFNLFPEYITVREKIADLDKIYRLLDELFKINADGPDTMLERMKQFAGEVQTYCLSREQSI